MNLVISAPKYSFQYSLQALKSLSNYALHLCIFSQTMGPWQESECWHSLSILKLPIDLEFKYPWFLNPKNIKRAMAKYLGLLKYMGLNEEYCLVMPQGT